MSKVNKAFEAGPQEPAPGEDPMLPMFDPYDMNIPQSVQTHLASVGSVSDKDLFKLAQEVWGDGYEYRPISRNHLRAELRGWLQDQIEWLQMNPIAQMAHQQNSLQMPTEMPHSSDSAPNSGPGGENSSALLHEPNLDGNLSQDETQPSSNNSGY